MDYDDNDFQSQNLQLAGEGSTKFPPVLRPYALPKFDFDDSLQGHLRFDSLVETEVFLGIQSQEDNQWIEDFSRGSSGIEFSSSAAESCSISRRNNVWSEATSSESVEMLLKSVGQEELIPGKTIIEESDACDELGSLTKQMEPSLKQDDYILSKIGDVIDSGPTLPAEELLESFSGLNEDAVEKLSRVDDTSQTHEGESSAYGSSSNLDPNIVSDKYGLTVADGNLLIGSRCNNADQREVDTSVDESLDNRTREDSSSSGMQVDNIVTSSQNVTTSIGELNNQEAPHQKNDISDENADGLRNDNGEGGEEHHVLSEEAQMDDQIMDGNVVESGGTYNLENPLCLASKGESMGERNAVETSIKNVEEPSRMILKGDSDLQMAEGCSEDVCSIIPVQVSKCEVVVLSQDTKMDDQFKKNTHEGSAVASEGDNSFEGQVVEVSNTNAGICSSLELKMDSLAQVTCGQSCSVEKKEDVLERDHQLDSEISVSNSEAPMLSVEDIELPKSQCDGTRDGHVGDLSSLLVVSSSAELLRETLATENVKGVHNAFGGSRDDLNAEGHASSYILAESTQICEKNVVSKQSDVHKFDRDVSVIEKGNPKSPSDSSNMDSEIVGSLIVDKRVGSLSFGEGGTENEVAVCKLQSDTTGNEPASDGGLEDTNMSSHDTLDGVPLPSGNSITTDEVIDHKEGGKLPLLIVGFTHLDGKEEATTEISTEVSFPKGYSQVASELGPVSEFEKGDTAGQLLYETVDQSLSEVEVCDTASRTEPQAAVANKVGQEFSKELEVCLLPRDSTLKEGDGAEAVVLENYEEATIKENSEDTSLKTADVEPVPYKGKMLTQPVPSSLDESCCDIGQKGQEDNEATLVPEDNNSGQIAVQSMEGDALNNHEVSFSTARLSECDANVQAVEGASSFADSDKRDCGSPTVISCTELSQSEKEIREGVKGCVDQNVPVSEIIDGVASKVCSSSKDPKGNDASQDERSFTFEVSSLAGLSERGNGKGWQPFPTIQVCKISPIVEGSPSTSGLVQTDPKMAQEISQGSPQASDGEVARSGSKGTPERKTRRALGKAPGKENAKKGNHVKGTTPARQSERGDKSCNVSLSPLGTSQLVRSEEMQHYGHMERSSTKPSGVHSTLTSNLPDLNTSASPSVLFQQPFTDVQQVQLRAQIFVYGSLIQGTAPDEACMISAFGASDGGRNIWENAWRASVERLHGQKSHSNNPETPLQSRSGARAPDQAIKHGALQSKVISSPVGRASSKGTPSTVVNPMIPLSSPLWSIPTPTDGRQSSGMPRGALLDYHQALSPLHPYQTPPLRNFVGHNPSWPSHTPFPGPWVASPQTSVLDASARFSALPITETVQLTPVRESSVPHSSATKHVSPSPMIHSGGPTNIFAGTSPLIDMKKATVSPGQHSADPKPRKRKKIPVSEDLGQISLPAHTQIESVSAPGVTSHPSTSVAIETLACVVSKNNTGKLTTAVSPTSFTEHLNIGDRDAKQRVIFSEETLSKIKEAELQAENAAALAAAAVSHSQGIWSQLDKQKNSGLISDVEAKVASAAVAIAAAAAVAKAAAAAAKIASDAAFQAKLMADEALVSSGNGNPSQSNGNSLSDGGNYFGKATPASILKGGDGTNCSNSIIVAAREAARRRVEATSAASKRAENLNAIVKAAELAAEAVSQAGKIVAMGDPLPLSALVEAGPEGYWKVPQESSDPVVKLNMMNREQSNKDSVEEGFDISAKHSEGGPSHMKERQTTNPGKPPTPRDMSRESLEDHMRLVDGKPGSVTTSEKDSRGQKGRKGSDLAKTIGVVPESEIGPRSTSITVQNEYEKAVETFSENSIKEGSLIEVFKDGDGFKAGWFSANVLTLKDRKAYVCYTELPSDEGSGQRKEWVALEGEGDKAPKIRIAHPMTSMRFEGTRKRRRAAMGDYVWSVGDRVDAWIRDGWWEGVVTEKSKKDETALTVHFPAQGETSVVRAWHLRPSLIWMGGEWIEASCSRENDCSSLKGDTPQEKRLKLGSPAVEAKGKDKISKDIDVVESGKPEESRLLALSASEKIFNVGKNTRDVNKPDALRTIRGGLLKEGSRVNFGVPKPGKKRKFMEVSKHYVADRGSKINETNDSVKFTKYLIPQGSGSRGWRNTSKIDSKEKRAAESKPKVLKSGRLHSVSSRSITHNKVFLTSAVSAPHDGTVTDQIANINDSDSHCVNASGKQNVMELESFSITEGAAEGQIMFSSIAPPSDAPSSKKMSTSNAKSERVNKGKLGPSGGKLAKIEEDKVYNGNSGKSILEAVEPRRSNRRIQPTSRLLEGLQSSLIISKIPAVSHDKSHKSQNRSTSSRGNNHG